MGQFIGYLLLVLCALAYGVGIVAQSAAADRAVTPSGGSAGGLLAGLVRDPVYLIGLAAQVAGFVLAFYARASLPLYLVQAGASAAVAVAAVIGAVVLGRRIRPLELGVIVAMAVGLGLLVASAETSVAEPMPVPVGFALLGLLGLVALSGFAVTRWSGTRGAAVVLGLLSGTAFAVLAVAGRPIADLPLWSLLLQPLAWLMVVAALAGQVLQAAALQRGTATAAIAPSYAMSTVLAAVVGLVALGDRIAPGREPWVSAGLAVVVAGVVVLSLSGAGHGQPAESATGEERSPV